MSEHDETASDDILQDRLWRKNGWTAKVVPNPDDDGWAVEMTRAGDPEPALLCPWVMGRDKKNPKPLNPGDFATLVKTAAEVIRRHEQANAPKRTRHTGFDEAGERWEVECVDVYDEFDPHALVTAYDGAGNVLHQQQMPPGYKLKAAAAAQFAQCGELERVRGREDD